MEMVNPMETSKDLKVPLVDSCRQTLSSCRNTSQHRRSRSVPDSLLHKGAPRMSPGSSHRTNSIVHVERRLHDQCSLQRDLEKALECNSYYMTSNSSPVPKPTADLVKEIALLEMEVMHLEQHLLSLYRAAFNNHVPLPCPGMKSCSGSCLQGTEIQTTIQETSKIQSTQQNVNNKCTSAASKMCSLESSEKQRSSQSQCAPNRRDEYPANSDTCTHSPKEIHKSDVKKSSLHTLADHLGTSVADLIPMTPDRLSEEIIRCMSSIYCKLANHSMPQIGQIPSPASSSSLSTASTQDPCDDWSPPCNDEIMANPCDPAGLKEKRTPYSEMVDILAILVDDDRFTYAASMLQSFRSLIQRLEKVDPRKMNREEQLAFWINIHNALVMHASLAYGISHNMKNVPLALKAAYNVGGQSVNAYEIKNSILECRTYRPSPWLPVMFRTGNGRHVYALDQPEPLSHFALCSGTYSDPAVRVYTSKHVLQELEIARDEFIQVCVSVHEKKIVIPKILYHYAKGALIDLRGILDMVCKCVTEAQQKDIKKCLVGGPAKSIKWLPYNSSFRYIIHRELTKDKTSN